MVYQLQGKLVSLNLQVGIQPSLIVTFEITVPTRIGNVEVQLLRVTGLSGVLAAVTKTGELPVGPLEPMGQEFSGTVGYPSNLQTRVWLGPSAVEKLEQLRHEGDGHIRFRFFQNIVWGQSWITGKDNRETGPSFFQFNPNDYRYVRDDWLAALEQIGYRRWRVYEAPDLDVPKEWNVTEHLDRAWLVLRQGNPDDAMQECRKALEALKQVALAKGAGVKNAGKDEIDFHKLTGSDTLGDTLEKIWTGTWGFQVLGQHHGTTIRQRDGEFAVSGTVALARYISDSLRT